MALEFPDAEAWTTDDPDDVLGIPTDELDGEQFAVAEDKEGFWRTVWSVRRESGTDVRVSLWRCEGERCEQTEDSIWWAIGEDESVAEFTSQFAEDMLSMKVKQARVYHDRGRAVEVTRERTPLLLRVLSRFGIRN